MGCQCSNILYDELDEYDYASARIVNQKLGRKLIQDEKGKNLYKYKLLLFGTNEEGKSVLLMHMREHQALQYDDSELMDFRPQVIQSLIEAMITLARYAKIAFNDHNETIRKRVSQMNLDANNKIFTEEQVGKSALTRAIVD